jgi:hypothetical protein
VTCHAAAVTWVLIGADCDADHPEEEAGEGGAGGDYPDYPGCARALSADALAHEIDIGVIVVGRPMALEIVEEGGPVWLEAMRLEIAQREREAMIDAD